MEGYKKHKQTHSNRELQTASGNGVSGEVQNIFYIVKCVVHIHNDERIAECERVLWIL